MLGCIAMPSTDEHPDVNMLASLTKPPNVAGLLLTWLLQLQVQSSPDKIHKKATPIDVSLVPV